MYEPNRYEKREIAAFLQSRLCVRNDPTSPDEAQKVGYVDAIAGPDLIVTVRIACAIEEEAARQIGDAYGQRTGKRKARLDFKSLCEAVGCREIATAAAHMVGFYRVMVRRRSYWVDFADPDLSSRDVLEAVSEKVTFEGLAWDVDEFISTEND